MKCVFGLCECPDPAIPKRCAAFCQCECHLFDFPGAEALSTTERMVR